MEYRFEVEKVRGDSIPTMARIYAGERVVATVNRYRKRKNAKWEIRVGLTTGYGSLPVAEFRAQCEAVAALALHPWGDE